MKIKDFAKEKGVSIQAVYQRLRSAGIDIASLKQSKNGELTEEGIKICERLYLKDDESKNKEIKSLNERLNDLKSENENLKRDLEQKNAEIERLTADRNRWASMAEAAQLTAQQAQAISMATLQNAAKQPRLSWWQKITGKRIKAAEAAEKQKE